MNSFVIRPRRRSHPRFRDETGKHYGLVEVIERVENSPHGNAQWRCRCACGNIFIASGISLRSGYADSCGCTRGQRKPKQEMPRPSVRANRCDHGFIAGLCYDPKCRNWDGKM
jgi:hypothetical protein